MNSSSIQINTSKQNVTINSTNAIYVHCMTQNIIYSTERSNVQKLLKIKVGLI